MLIYFLWHCALRSGGGGGGGIDRPLPNLGLYPLSTEKFKSYPLYPLPLKNILPAVSLVCRILKDQIYTLLYLKELIFFIHVVRTLYSLYSKMCVCIYLYIFWHYILCTYKGRYLAIEVLKALTNLLCSLFILC